MRTKQIRQATLGLISGVFLSGGALAGDIVQPPAPCLVLTQNPGCIALRRHIEAESALSEEERSERNQHRAVQRALRGFGFEPGEVDGLMGGQTRAAIARYQAFMDRPASGVLTFEERQWLLKAYAGAERGDWRRYRNLVAAEGRHALLLRARDPDYGAEYGPPVDLEAERAAQRAQEQQLFGPLPPLPAP